ncbi:hypothetical protein A9K55_003460 [Cordyceps militaris]|uniref:Uncharacterized protein n=1 Tax=Cordyceps militaris TaxID=73501 RepID=A0A2H4S9L4_CORMI|nr:hypothetical protein A9K55_003460 [Cordyceps militaris]
MGNARDSNPLSLWPAFRKYRGARSPEYDVWAYSGLEDAVLDGRHNVIIRDRRYDRDMLIKEYVCAILFSKRQGRNNRHVVSPDWVDREVPRYLQSIEGLFKDLRCFHMLFDSGELTEPVDALFTSNAILVAFLEDRVPDAKPNYAYWAVLLGLQRSIPVRIEAVDLFVSSLGVDGQTSAVHDHRGTPLSAKGSRQEHPSIVLENKRIIHQYARGLQKTTSACVSTVTGRWKQDSPGIYSSLNLPRSDSDCLLIELHTSLNLHETGNFPYQSKLSGSITVSFAHDWFHTHRWKCTTRLSYPSRWHHNRDEYFLTTHGFHCSGCREEKSNCDCGDFRGLNVPFPATKFDTLLKLAEDYGNAELEREAGRIGARPMGRVHETATLPTLHGANNFLRNIAMYQELWSFAPGSSVWIRQAIIFWRFKSTPQGLPQPLPASTTWRWLSIYDPLWKVHEENIIIDP